MNNSLNVSICLKFCGFLEVTLYHFFLLFHSGFKRLPLVVEFTEPNIVFKFTQTGCGYSVWVRFWDEKRKRKYAVTQFFSLQELGTFREKVLSAYAKYANRFAKE